MHDTFLNERLYEAILKLCKKNKMQKINRLHIAVNLDSHISENSLREHFMDRNNNLLGDWTEIMIHKQEVGKLNAVLQSIEGESLDA